MGNLRVLQLGALVLNLLAVGINAQDSITLNNYFSNEMVFQRNVENIIWGYGTYDGNVMQSCVLKDGDKTVMELKPEQVSANVWQVKTTSNVEHTRCTFTFTETLKLEDVVYGDVWLCSGQSNMELWMQNIENSADEISDAVENYGYGVRFTSVANFVLTEPNPDHNQDMQLPWSRADDGEAVKHFSAVCFMYGRNVFDVTGVPQGMVDADWGGTVIEAWSSQDALDACDVPSNSEGDQNADTVLWNGMINPILRVSLKGFLWYQGESNSYYNRDLYNCTFPAMIEDWRAKFSQVSGGTNIEAPFGFVQLAPWKPDTDENGFSVIRWHQTADVGIVPNPYMRNVFMSSPQDTYDPQAGYPGGVHPMYKQIVAERLANAGLNVAYGQTEYPTYGPYPVALTQEAADAFTTVKLEFDKDLQYLVDAEISGFYFCSESAVKCDEGTTVNQWMEVSKENVQQVDSRSVAVDLSEFGMVLGGSISYLWRESPVKALYMLPIYSDDEFRMPTPPFKYDLA